MSRGLTKPWLFGDFLTRYAHLFDDPLRAATERVGAIVTGTGTKQPADVITFNRR
jgi:hypothetical protein